MKFFTLRKNGIVTRADSNYKSFGMEPRSFPPLTEFERRLQSARSEIQERVHEALLSAGAGRFGVRCTSLHPSGKSLSFRLFINSIKVRDFKEDRMKKVDVKSIVSSVLKKYLGNSAVGSASVDMRFSKGTHDPRIAPEYDVEWSVKTTLKTGRKDSVSARKDSSAEVAPLLKAHGISFLTSSRYPNGLEFSSANLRDKALELIHTSLPHISAFPKDVAYDKKTYFLVLW